MNSKSKTILVSSVVAVAVGVGVILVIKNRNNIKRQIQIACNVNPLKFREIQIINNVDEAQIAVRRLKRQVETLDSLHKYNNLFYFSTHTVIVKSLVCWVLIVNG
jgi:hypothetical protein